MRIAHLTDIHWQTPPRFRDLGPKRLLGTANLYLRGRRHHFCREVQAEAVRHVLALSPDLVIVSGDLTAQALPAEFALARRTLDPLLDALPTLVLRGNHDAYTQGAVLGRAFEESLGDWSHPWGPISRIDVGDVTVLGLDPNRPRWFTADGAVPLEQLEALRTTLEDEALQSRQVLLALHYPLLDRHGQPYERPTHGLRNARDVLTILASATVKPRAVLHGHVHHGYQVPLPGGATIQINPGSSGYAFLPRQRRAAALNLYGLSEDGLVVDRFLYTEDGFRPEPGGAYATGR